MIDLSRGAVVLFAERGDYTAKPRPGVVIQNDVTLPDASSITLCGLTTHLLPGNIARVLISPNHDNGLSDHSSVMVDKIVTIRRERIREKVGNLSRGEMLQVTAAIRRWLDL